MWRVDSRLHIYSLPVAPIVSSRPSLARHVGETLAMRLSFMHHNLYPFCYFSSHFLPRCVCRSCNCRLSTVGCGLVLSFSSVVVHFNCGLAHIFRICVALRVSFSLSRSPSLSSNRVECVSVCRNRAENKNLLHISPQKTSPFWHAGMSEKPYAKFNHQKKASEKKNMHTHIAHQAEPTELSHQQMLFSDLRFFFLWAPENVSGDGSSTIRVDDFTPSKKSKQVTALIHSDCYAFLFHISQWFRLLADAALFAHLRRAHISHKHTIFPVH